MCYTRNEGDRRDFEMNLRVMRCQKGFGRRARGDEYDGQEGQGGKDSRMYDYWIVCGSVRQKVNKGSFEGKESVAKN